MTSLHMLLASGLGTRTIADTQVASKQKFQLWIFADRLQHKMARKKLYPIQGASFLPCVSQEQQPQKASYLLSVSDHVAHTSDSILCRKKLPGGQPFSVRANRPEQFFMNC